MRISEKRNERREDSIKGDQMTIKDCNGKDIAVITVFAHEAEVTRMERITKRLTLAIVLETFMFIICLIIK